MKYRIKVRIVDLHGKHHKYSFTLTEGQSFKLGQKTTPISIPDPELLDEHIKFSVEQGVLTLKSLDTTHPFFLKEQATQETDLDIGDQVRFGKNQMEILEGPPKINRKAETQFIDFKNEVYGPQTAPSRFNRPAVRWMMLGVLGAAIINSTFYFAHKKSIPPTTIAAIPIATAPVIEKQVEVPAKTPVKEMEPRVPPEEKIWEFVSTDRWNELKAWITQYHLSPNQKHENGETLLSLSVKANQLDFVSFLVSQNVALDESDFFGKTALHYAVLSKSETLVSFLKNQGAQTDVLDKSGKSPIDYSIDLGNKGITNLYQILTLKKFPKVSVNVSVNPNNTKSKPRSPASQKKKKLGTYPAIHQ